MQELFTQKTNRVMDDKITLSIDETHHIKGGHPLYPHRFDKVLSFHFPPSYAAVKKDNRALFINVRGERVFEREFTEAYGFYEGIATVADDDGFFHIDKNGTAIHANRYFWSGNYQEDFCAVQSTSTKKFFHIDRLGMPIYSKEYAYVGDFRYGVAVVHYAGGNCTHIDKRGTLLHGEFFLELSNYHKGVAVAKDGQGYFHIDKKGRQLYSNRFSALEPPYNGRAVAIDHQGGTKLISLNGDTVKEINDSSA